MGYLKHTKTELNLMSLELWKRLPGRLNIAMSKANKDMITIRHGRIRRMRSLTKGRNVSNLLTFEISKSNHHKLWLSQPE